MIGSFKVVVVMPAYNAEKTLRQTCEEIPKDIVDEVILVDDASRDKTLELAGELGLKTFLDEQNKGYGANQKTCYQKALDSKADIIIMLHPDYQYTPKLIAPMAFMISEGIYDLVLASRILGKGAIKGGMPRYKYIANRLLTFIENVLIHQKLSEYHTGYRAFSREVLERLPLKKNSDDFIFDNQILVQAHYAGFKIGEISCPTKYFPEASSINFIRSVKYGFGVLATALSFFAHQTGLWRSSILEDIDDIKKKGNGS